MEDKNKNQQTAQVLALVKYAGISPRQFAALMHQFGDLDSLLQAEAESLPTMEGVEKQLAELILTANIHLELAADYLNDLTQRDIEIITCLDTAYPKTLEELNDPPPLLYCRGKTLDSSLKTVTVCGTGQASQEGIELTVNLSRKMAEAGVQLVSSLRGGIDAAVHLGARTADGRSFAVLDCGFDQLDLSEQTPLAVDIAQEGGLMTEFPPDVAYETDHVSVTNRLVVGLGQAVIVTEFYSDSKVTEDILLFCREIGKMVFIMVDPTSGALSDDAALAAAKDCGAVPIVGFEQLDGIVAALV